MIETLLSLPPSWDSRYLPSKAAYSPRNASNLSSDSRSMQVLRQSLSSTGSSPLYLSNLPYKDIRNW